MQWHRCWLLTPRGWHDTSPSFEFDPLDGPSVCYSFHHHWYHSNHASFTPNPCCSSTYTVSRAATFDFTGCRFYWALDATSFCCNTNSTSTSGPAN